MQSDSNTHANGDMAWCTVITVINNKDELWAWGRYVHHSNGESYLYTMEPRKISNSVISASSCGASIYYVKKNHVLYGLLEDRDRDFEEWINEPVKIMKKVRTVKQYYHSGIHDMYFLRTDGSLWIFEDLGGEIVEKKKVMTGF